MRSYEQYCALAKALDVIGDRWTLLIVRELLLRGPSRYTDLKNGLPGIATNLLVDRLRELEEAGIVRREAAPPPIATTLVGLRLAVMRSSLCSESWVAGGVSVAKRAGNDAFRSHWLALPEKSPLKDRKPDRPVTLEVRAGTASSHETAMAWSAHG